MLIYPVIRIEWKKRNWWTFWRFEICGRICKMVDHVVVDPTMHAYPGHIFCQRCRRHFRREEQKWKSNKSFKPTIKSTAA